MASNMRSARLSDDVLGRLDAFAARHGMAMSSAMERLLDEALRREAHPRITFRDGPSGRRAGLIAGPDVDEVIRALRAAQSENPGDAADLVDSVATSMTLTAEQIRAAVAYYADHPSEIDDRIAVNADAADELEVAWRRQHEGRPGQA